MNSIHFFTQDVILPNGFDDSPPLREQLAELLRLDMDQLLSPYNTRKIQTIAAILLSFRTLPCLRLRGLYLNASRSSLLSTTASF